MLRLLRHLLDSFRDVADPDSPRPGALALPDRIKRWRRQAEEFESLGCRELARQYRASIDAHERTLRKVA